jgi:hypothetical protein
MDAEKIASAGLPVLCVDTCSILDILRDPTRESCKPHEMQAAVDLVSKAETNRAILLMAEQVSIEFSSHDQDVQDESLRQLKKFRENAERINELSGVFGAASAVNLIHLDTHVARARIVVGRWVQQLQIVVPGPTVLTKAFNRVNAAIAPARRGKDSFKDCVVYETYLEAVDALRNSGLTTPIVFLSSNTKEYMTEGGKLKAEIEAEFKAMNLDYAPNMAAAKNSLGL